MIRKAKQEHISRLKALFPSTHSYEAWKEDEIWYYSLDGTEAGFFALKENTITCAFVAPDYRDKGIGKELFEGVKTLFLARACFRVTTPAVEESRDFFLHLGFQLSQDKKTLIYSF